MWRCVIRLADGREVIGEEISVDISEGQAAFPPWPGRPPGGPLAGSDRVARWAPPQVSAEGLPTPQSMEAVTCGNVRLGKVQSVGVLSRTPSG